MQNLKTLLKKKLPAQVSYPLRVAKALRVDQDLRALEQLCKTCNGDESVAIDVGANVGIYAAVMSDILSRFSALSRILLALIISALF